LGIKHIKERSAAALCPDTLWELSAPPDLPSWIKENMGNRDNGGKERRERGKGRGGKKGVDLLYYF